MGRRQWLAMWCASAIVFSACVPDEPNPGPDTTAPVVTVPAPMTVLATSSTGADVTWTASANDAVSGPIVPTCAPAPGPFPLGVTTVTCSATDAAGNTGSASFTVTVSLADSTAPTLSLPVDIVAEATSPAGAAVTWTTSAVDDVDGPVAVTCSHAPGAFPLGETEVSCSAVDAAGNTANGGFTITIADTTAPVLTLPAGITTSTTDPTGTDVTWTATALDAVDGALPATCTPPPGRFPVGTTTVSCTASDAADNVATAGFDVTVGLIDVVPPTLTVPADFAVEATAPNGADVTWSATATDDVDGTVPVTCDPEPGTFALGETDVECAATDLSDNAATGAFTVTVRDTTAPALTLPIGLSAVSTDGSGAAVNFAPTATDVVDGTVAVTCTPTSGSTFPLGVTPVSCSATDAAGNTETGSFDVTVSAPEPVERYSTTPGVEGEAFARRLVIPSEPNLTDFQVVDGAMHPDLTLSPDGVISGTPTTGGIHAVTIEAKAPLAGARVQNATGPGGGLPDEPLLDEYLGVTDFWCEDYNGLYYRKCTVQIATNIYRRQVVFPEIDLSSLPSQGQLVLRHSSASGSIPLFSQVTSEGELSSPYTWNGVPAVDSPESFIFGRGTGVMFSKALTISNHMINTLTHRAQLTSLVQGSTPLPIGPTSETETISSLSPNGRIASVLWRSSEHPTYNHWFVNFYDVHTQMLLRSVDVGEFVPFGFILMNFGPGRFLPIGWTPDSSSLVFFGEGNATNTFGLPTTLNWIGWNENADKTVSIPQTDDTVDRGCSASTSIVLKSGRVLLDCFRGGAGGDRTVLTVSPTTGAARAIHHGELDECGACTGLGGYAGYQPPVSSPDGTQVAMTLARTSGGGQVSRVVTIDDQPLPEVADPGDPEPNITQITAEEPVLTGTIFNMTLPHAWQGVVQRGTYPTEPQGRGSVDVEAGDEHNCARSRGDVVQCWGANDRGQLGNGTFFDSAPDEPAVVVGLPGEIDDIGVGGDHSCAVIEDGAVMCWGANGQGQLGDGTTTDSNIPVQVVGIANAVRVSAGGTTTCAVLADGTATCWGGNDDGQVGDGTTTDALTPVSLPWLIDVATMSPGKSHTCALVNAGEVTCWGEGSAGQLGDGNATDSLTPVVVPGTWTALSTAEGLCAVSATDGKASCWGPGALGQLGDGSTVASSPSPVQVVMSNGMVRSIESSGRHACALMANGGIRCWGANESWQVSNGTTTGTSGNTQQIPLYASYEVVVGERHSCGLEKWAQRVFCWGDNGRGQVGDGTTVDLDWPHIIKGLYR